MIFAFCLLFLISVLLVPSSLLLRPEYGISVVAFIIRAFTSTKRSRIALNIFRKDVLGKEIKWFLYLFVFASFSIFLQIVVVGEFGWRDVMVLVRYFIYAFFLMFGILVGIELKTNNKMPFLTVFYVLAVFVAIVSLIQYFDIGGLNNILVPIYSPKNLHLIEYETRRRVVGTFGNPNYWGCFLNYVAIYFYVNFVSKKSYLSLLIAILITLIMFLTDSRTAIVSLVAGLGVGLIYINKDMEKISFKRLTPASLLGLALLAVFVFFMASFVYVNYFYENSRAVSSGYDTLDERVRYWKEVMTNLFLSGSYELFFGYGPSKMQGFTWGDSIYIRMVRDYGFIGLIGFFGIHFTMLTRLKFIFRHSSNKMLSSFSLVACVILISRMFFDITADAWFDVRSVAVIYLMYGACIGLYLKETVMSSHSDNVRIG